MVIFSEPWLKINSDPYLNLWPVFCASILNSGQHIDYTYNIDPKLFCCYVYFT